MEKYPIYLVRMPSQYLLASTFMRFQEHYESPEFKGKFFTIEEFMDWYAKDKKGNFDYFKWRGFNIPSHILEPFYGGSFEPLLKKEKALLDHLKNIKHPSYIIGLNAKKKIDLSILKHEFVHGLYYSDESYREKVTKVVNGFKDKFDIESVFDALNKEGYDSSVYIDETNSYLMTGIQKSKLAKISNDTIEPMKKILLELFREHFDFSINEASEEFITNKIHTIDFSY